MRGQCRRGTFLQEPDAQVDSDILSQSEFYNMGTFAGGERGVGLVTVSAL